MGTNFNSLLFYPTLEQANNVTSKFFNDKRTFNLVRLVSLVFNLAYLFLDLALKLVTSMTPTYNLTQPCFKFNEIFKLKSEMLCFLSDTVK